MSIKYDNIKGHKKPGFHTFFRGYIFGKSIGEEEGGQINFGIRTSYKELIQGANYPNTYIHTFPKRLRFVSAFSL